MTVAALLRSSNHPRYSLAAAKLTKAHIAAALRRGGRQRGADQLAAWLHQVLRHPQLRQDPMVRLLTTLTPNVTASTSSARLQPTPSL